MKGSRVQKLMGGGGNHPHEMQGAGFTSTSNFFTFSNSPSLMKFLSSTCARSRVTPSTRRAMTEKLLQNFMSKSNFNQYGEIFCMHTRIRWQFLSTKKEYIWKLKYYFNFLTSNDKRAEDSGLEKS